MSEDFIRSVSKRLAPLGGTYMLSPRAMNAAQSAGVDPMSYYALGRGGALGDVDGRTVADAFFFFNPDVVADIWDKAKESNDPRQIAAHYAEACATWGREKLSEIEGLDRFCEIADRVARDAEPTPSSALFAAWRAMPLPDDAPGRAAVHLVLVLRELRGGAHIDAVKQVGLTPEQAVAVNSPQMYQLFGWTGEMPDAEPYRERAARAEDITDELVAPMFGSLSDDERRTFAHVVEAAERAGV